MNTLAGVAAGFMALFGASSTIDHRPPENDALRGHASSTVQVQGQANVACVAAAVAAREQALGTGISAYTQSINDAYSARASALAAAYTQTGTDAIKKAVKSAWTNFGAALKLGRRTWASAQGSAWSQFRTALKACGGSSTAISDASNASVDAGVAGGN